MQEIALFSLYLTLGVFIVSTEIWRMASRQPFNALSLFNGAYFIFFVFVPLNVLVYGNAAVRQKYAYQTWSHGDIGTMLVLLFCYVLFVFGYFNNCTRLASAQLNALTLIKGDHDIAPTVQFLVVAFACLGIAALAYHVSLMGGVANTLFLAPRARTGEFELNSPFLFVRQFCYFCATAFMLQWAMYLDVHPARASRRMVINLATVFLGMVFVFYVLSTYGRREFLYPIAICFAVWLFAGQKRSWSKLGWLIALGMVWVWMYSFVIPAGAPTAVSTPPIAAVSTLPIAVHAHTTQTAVSISDFLKEAYFRTVQGLGDSFMHFVAAQHAELWQFGFLTDLWELPAQFLPSKLLGFDRGRGMFGETSAFVLGHPLEAGLSGEEPLGMHGYLLVNFGYPGLLLLFYLAGIGYRLLDRNLRPAKGGGALAWLIFMWVIIGALEFLREGVLVLVLKQRFSWWLAIGILLLWTGKHTVKGLKRPTDR